MWRGFPLSYPFGNSSSSPPHLFSSLSLPCKTVRLGYVKITEEVRKKPEQKISLLVKWLWLLYYFHSILSLVYLFLLSWVRCVMDISVNFHLRDLNILVPNSVKLPFISNKFSSANDQGNLAQLPFVISAGYFAVCFVFLRFYCRRCHLQTSSWLSLYR